MKNQGYRDLLMCFDVGDGHTERIRVEDRNTSNNNLLETQDSTQAFPYRCDTCEQCSNTAEQNKQGSYHKAFTVQTTCLLHFTEKSDKLLHDT